MLIQEEVKEIYVWEDVQEWQPGENTLLYFPLKENAVDTVHSISLNSYGTTSYTEVGGVKSAQFTKSNWLYNYSVNNIPQGDIAKTMSVWVYIKGSNTGWSGICGMGGTGNGSTFGLGLYYNTYNLLMTRYGSTSGTYTPTLNKWLNVVISYSNSSWKMYVNGELKVSWNTTAPTSGYSIGLGQLVGSTETTAANTFYGNISDFIIENKARTADEIQNYYNKYKPIYGL